MLLSLLKRRREAKAAQLLAEAQGALLQQSELIAEMRLAVAAYHSTVFRRETAKEPTHQSNDLRDLLAALEDAADSQATWSRVYDDLTLSHCRKVRSALRTRQELERDLPSALQTPGDDHAELSASQTGGKPVSKRLIRRINELNEAALSATKNMQWLNDSYAKETRVD